MKTNFFATIAPILGSMNLTFTVAKGSGDTVIVSILPQPRIKDNAKENIQPMVIRGTIEELDNEFFEAIKKPMGDVTGIVINIDEFEKGAERLAEQSKAAAELKAKAKKDKEKSDKIVKKAQELFDAGDIDKAKKELEKAIKLTPGTTSVNSLHRKITDAIDEAEKNKAQTDLFVEVEKAEAKVAPIVNPLAEKADEVDKLPESPNELEIENNRIVQSAPMSEDEIEALQEEMNQKWNVNQESNDNTFSI